MNKSGSLGSIWVLAVATFTVAVAIRFAIASQDLLYVDRLFLPDDTYYSLAIARNIARGIGPSADGFILTNGFQPLITFAQVPIFWLGAGPDQAVRCAVFETAFLGSCAAAALGALMARIAGRPAGWMAGMIAAVNPAIIGNDLNGLETSLSLLVDLMVLHAVLSYARNPTAARECWLGALFGASLLARIDNCFLIMAVTPVLLRQVGLRSVGVAFIAALAVVAPWWLYSLQVFGHIIPESGQAVKQIMAAHSGSGSLLADGIWAIKTALIVVGRLLTALYRPAGLSAGVGLAVVVSLLAYGWRIGRASGGRAFILQIIIVTCIMSFLFYAIYLPAFWFFARYLHFVQIGVIAVASALLGRVWRISAQGADDTMSRRAMWAVPPVLLLLMWWVARDAVFFSQPGGSIDRGAEGAKGYREVALDILQHVPPQGTLGAMQSGALGYYAADGIRVFNLDGVVNRGAYEAIRAHRLGQYVADMGIGYFADWEFNVRFLVDSYGRDGERPALRFLYAAEAQGEDRSSLYAFGGGGAR